MKTNYRSQPLSRFEHYPRARLALILALAVPFLGICVQLGRLTLAQGDQYSELAARNMESNVRLSSPRGNILDRKGRLLATNVRTFSVTFTPYGMRDTAAREVLNSMRPLIPDLDDNKIEAILAERPRWTRHRLLRRASEGDILPLIERAHEFPGVRLEQDFRREYPYPIEHSLLVGHVGRIPSGQEDRFVRPRYLPDDEIGRAGIEASLEDQLAGHPGRERLTRDARGRLLAAPELIEPARAGLDVQLTTDADLQQHAHQLLGAETGSIIVMDVKTGDLIVMASTPAYDPRRPWLTEIDGRKAGFLNLAARGLYPPGSTFKIVGASVALRSGMTPSDRLHCSGSHRIAGWQRPFWCNQRTGHGGVNLSDSLKYSCNSYYYQLAERLGPAVFVAEAERFGFSLPTGFQLAERIGSLSDRDRMAPGESINFSIGQGKFLATPLQVVRSFAGVATGVLPIPRLVQSIGGEAQPVAPGTALDVPASTRTAITHGLARAVNEPGGTAFKAQIPRAWQVVGKTGTAENSSGGVDAWFAGFFPQDSPRWAFVVHIAGAGGHGGEIAGPIGREMIHHVLEAEGILPPRSEVGMTIAPRASSEGL